MLGAVCMYSIEGHTAVIQALESVFQMIKSNNECIEEELEEKSDENEKTQDSQPLVCLFFFFF